MGAVLKGYSRAILFVFVGLLLLVRASSTQAADVTVFAAASLGDALQDVGKAWQEKTGHIATFSFAASSALA